MACFSVYKTNVDVVLVTRYVPDVYFIIFGKRHMCCCVPTRKSGLVYYKKQYEKIIQIYIYTTKKRNKYFSGRHEHIFNLKSVRARRYVILLYSLLSIERVLYDTD